MHAARDLRVLGIRVVHDATRSALGGRRPRIVVLHELRVAEDGLVLGIVGLCAGCLELEGEPPVPVHLVNDIDGDGIGDSGGGLVLRRHLLIVEAASRDERNGGEHRHALQERAVFSCAARHAVMNRAKSGLGASGFDLNSGWNWTPTPQG